MSCSYTAALALVLAGAAAAQNATVSIGVRESELAGDSFIGYGAAGLASGGIEWIDLTGKPFVMDGTWQQFTFVLDQTLPNADPVTAFAGTSANGMLEGTFGVLENIRITNTGGSTEYIEVFVDDMVNTTTAPNVVQDFEGHPDGIEVMFQEATYSGSTAGFVMGPSVGFTESYADNTVASRPFGAQRIGPFAFINNTPTNWVRLTTHNVGVGGNPQIRFDQGSTLSFWLRAGTDQANLGSQGPGNAIMEMTGEGLAANETSTLWMGGATPGNPGVLVVSANGFPDIPFLDGSNLVSFGGFLFSFNVVADANGQVSVPVTLPGVVPLADTVFQAAFLDLTQMSGFEFTNAINVLVGQ